VALKTMEGTAGAVGGAVRDAAKSGFFAAIGGLLMRRSLGRLRRELDPESTGGAILLGLRGVAVIAHGSSGPAGIANAIRLAERGARERAVERTAELLERSGASRAAVRAGLERDRSAAS
jgi:phosphate acyltransferase